MEVFDFESTETPTLLSAVPAVFRPMTTIAMTAATISRVPIGVRTEMDMTAVVDKPVSWLEDRGGGFRGGGRSGGGRSGGGGVGGAEGGGERGVAK